MYIYTSSTNLEMDFIRRNDGIFEEIITQRELEYVTNTSLQNTCMNMSFYMPLSCELRQYNATKT